MNDLFISYAHIDDIVFELESGWVTNFQKRLTNRLTMKLGRQANVFFDPQIRKNEEIGPALLIQLANVELLLAVISPAYLNSPWCPVEADEFHRAVGLRGGSLSAGHRSRVFKVIKSRIDDPQPPFCTGPGIYEFYAYDELRKDYYEFSELAGSSRDKRYWDTLEEVVMDVAQLIKILSGPPVLRHSPVPEKTVYLAEVARDLRDEYLEMRRELKILGYQVLPDSRLPLRKSEFVPTVQRYLQQSRLSIHMFGQEGGDLVEGDHGESVVMWQNKLAAELSRTANFPRIIWTPAETRIPGTLGQFIERLEEDEEAQKGADLVLRKPLNELLEVTRRRLRCNAESSAGTGSTTTPGLKTIHLIFDKQDVDQIPPITQYLHTEGFQVSLPLLDDSATNAIEGHRRKLEQCDGALIYYGKATQAWLEYNLQYLDKVMGLKMSESRQFNASPSLPCRVICLADPRTAHKALFTTQQFEVVTAFGGLDPIQLQEFANRVKGNHSK